MPKKESKPVRKRVYLGKGDNGRPVYKSVTGKNDSEAAEKALQIKLAMRKGIDVTADRDTFKKWADRWLALKKDDVSAGRLNIYGYAIDKMDPLWLTPIIKVRTGDIQDIINDLAEKNPRTGKPTARKTLIDVKSAAVQIFQLAVEQRVIDYNPAAAVKIPKKAPQSSRRALTHEEQQWIVNTPHRAQRGAMIMMYAGLRRGELIPLLWSDVDLKAQTIDVNKSVEIIDGKSVQKDGKAKTESSIRTVNIPQQLVDFLTFEKKKSGITPDTENTLVLQSARGTMLTESGWQRLWQSYWAALNLKYGDFTAYKKAHPEIDFEKPESVYNPHGVPPMIPPITAHWLRHTFATLLYLAEVDVLTARDQLGHSDIKTTLEIYTHLDKVYKRHSMDKLSQYISGKITNPEPCVPIASKSAT
ncbi:tyrosine-type recombinase/integrase [Faecalispora jeddahensis]|uniref:tyrosine-type recombinase/integrase n=1 Tax=Faecalispora jeddahensis TaxID=1414721 RepID=UPI001899FFF1|nr:site-specific integrase [Faecalispora jeddahensis]MDU6306669.1 site-specific integrase [Clostridium sp.]MDU6347404.1 site-specific integrase [Clostridium sp.]